MVFPDRAHVVGTPREVSKDHAPHHLDPENAVFRQRSAELGIGMDATSAAKALGGLCGGGRGATVPGA